MKYVFSIDSYLIQIIPCYLISVGGYSIASQFSTGTKEQHKTKNKNFRCVFANSTKNRCHGSMTITPNLQIVQKVEHICNDFGTEDKPLEDKDLEKVQEFEVIGKKYKINGHLHYFRLEFKSKNKYFQCILANSTKNRCHGSITITPNLQIAKKNEHNCDQVCEITPQQSSETTEKEESPTLSVGWL